MDSGRVVEIRARRPDGDDSVGSGYRVSERLVLTARHVICDHQGSRYERPRVRRPDIDADWASGLRVVWCGDGDLDAALLELAAGCWPDPAAARVRWGRLTGQQAGVTAEAQGFPLALREEGRRTREHLDGHVNPGTAAGRRYDINLASAVPDTGLWGGMSGAALFAGQLLVGVIVIDTPNFNGRRLTAVPVHRLAADPGFRAALDEALVEVLVESVELAELFAGSNDGVYGVSIASMLRADAEAVGFHGRRAMLDELLAWCRQPVPLSAWLMIGPGGQGKTRLARELCHELRPHEWIADFVADKADADAISPLSHTALPVLAVIDYAETRAGQIETIVSRALQRAGTVPIRLLLLARSAGDWWGELVGASRQTEAVLAAAPVSSLDPLDETPLERQRSYDEALADFAHRLNDVKPGTDWPSVAMTISAGQPTAPSGTSALDIHMSALVDLLQAGPEPVSAEESPTEEARGGPDQSPEHTLHRHEQRYWRQTAIGRGLDLKPSDVRDFAVTAATLMGAVTRAEALDTVARLPGLRDKPETDRYVATAWLRDLYPAPEGRYWGPLQPDRLGEHVVAHAAQRSPDWFTPALAGASDEQRHLALTVLARATDRHHSLQPFLTDLLRDNLPALAPHAITVATQTANPEPLAAALQQAAHTADLESLIRIVYRLPTETTALATLGAALNQELVERLREAGPEQLPGLAETLNNLSIRLRRLKREDAALTASQEAVTLLRRLVEAGREEQRPSLASALGTAASALGALKRYEEALAADREAVSLHRILAEASPEDYRPDLGRVLTNMAVTLRRLERPQEALAASQEAVALYRPLATADPRAHLANLAHALTNLAVDLGQLDHPQAALAASQEAVELRRRLAADDPDAHLANLAKSLTTLADDLGQLDHPETALVTRQEAVEAYRALAAANIDLHGTDAANALLDLADDLLRLERPDKAFAADHEAVELYRVLAVRNPEAHLANLVSALIRLADNCVDFGHPEEALATSQEATDLLRSHSAGIRGVPSYVLGLALDTSAKSLVALGRLPEAQVLRDEAERLLS